MKTTNWTVLVALAVLGVAHCGGGDDKDDTGGGNPVEGTLCEQRCAKTAVKCPNEPSCVETCELLVGLSPPCSDVVSAHVSCANDRPDSDWSCDPQGRSKLPEDVCQTEWLESLQCLAHEPPDSMPNMTDACTKSCAAMADLPCAPANCVQTCLDGITAEHCGGAAGLVALCGANLTKEDFACANGVPLPLAKCEVPLIVYGWCAELFSSE